MNNIFFLAKWFLIWHNVGVVSHWLVLSKCSTLSMSCHASLHVVLISWPIHQCHIFFCQPFVSKIKYAYQIEQNLKVLHNTVIYLQYLKVTSNELLHECFVRLSQNWKDGKKTKWNNVNLWEGIAGPCHVFNIIY